MWLHFDMWKVVVEARMVAKAFERIWYKVCEISELVGNVGKQFDSMKQ